MRPRRSRAASAGRHDDEGLAAVEFALLLPVLVVLLFGIVVTGLVFIGRLQVQAAAREGARAGALLSGQGCSSAREQLTEFAPSEISCSETRDCPTVGSRVEIRVVETVSIPLLGDRQVTLDSTSVYACQS